MKNSQITQFGDITIVYKHVWSLKFTFKGQYFVDIKILSVT